MKSVSQARAKKHMTAAERHADLKQKVQQMYNNGWTHGQIGLQLNLAISSVRTFLGHKQMP